jgi:hypothetical protein
MEKLKAELEKAKQETAVEKAAAQEAVAALSALRATSDKHQARVEEIQLELKDASKKCEALELKEKERAAELSTLKTELQKERVDRRTFEEEISQAQAILSGKPYLLQCVFGDDRFKALTQVWRSVGAGLDLQKSAADAKQFYASRGEGDEARVFWAQFGAPERTPLLNEQLKQLLELYKVAEPAMKDLCIRLWPNEPIPGSYFGLVQKLSDATARIDALRRSSCIEGARMTFAKAKVHWPGLDPMKVATAPPPPGKEYRCPERYFSGVMEGARAIESQCLKDTVYE